MHLDAASLNCLPSVCMGLCFKISFYIDTHPNGLGNCGRLSQNGPQRLLYLNIWFPVVKVLGEG